MEYMLQIYLDELNKATQHSGHRYSTAAKGLRLRGSKTRPVIFFPRLKSKRRFRLGDGGG
jgi:hypothetical protein